MFDLRLTDEQLAIRAMVQEFVKQEVEPVALELDAIAGFEARYPWGVVVKGSQLGLRTLALSVANGGAGADGLTGCIVAEELAKGDIGIAVTFGQTGGLAHNYFDEIFSDEQRARFLPDFLADDRYHLAVGLHEPDTDVGYDYYVDSVPTEGDKTISTRDARGNWVVNGTKNFQTNGSVAKLMVVRTRSEAGPTALIVPMDSPGLRRTQIDAAGRRLASWAELSFENVTVPPENLVGQAGRAPALGFGPGGHVRWAAMCLGVARSAYESALAFAKTRVQGGKPIVQHQAIGLALADMATAIEVGRALTFQAAWACDHPGAPAETGLGNQPLAPAAFLFASEVASSVTLRASEVFGGSGLMRKLPMQKYIRDATVYRYAAPRDVNALKYAEALVGYRRQTSLSFVNQ
ncbi:MAG: acyl-CoA dehydrogenase family protein [Chloroflexi bacterium]|nr:acyl-CoA dehydrogenase family protein [Chloroflexota bacterium]